MRAWLQVLFPRAKPRKRRIGRQRIRICKRPQIRGGVNDADWLGGTAARRSGSEGGKKVSDGGGGGGTLMQIHCCMGWSGAGPRKLSGTT